MRQHSCFHVSGILETWKFTSDVEPLNSGKRRVRVPASFLLPRSFVTIRVGLEETLRFNELVRLLEQNEFRLTEKRFGSLLCQSRCGQTDSG